ncbi:amino acid adenylation domain-containing protein [Amycolatopsis rubida]|uniref:Amino acid adenylation domain-containing protein n=1 Tax=Amycolatopsis rubida TaxID=112413 RepID=A0A1I6AHF2_9PSEU|nr:amino acid adenylation domain-containing protein [Amycolatopsis rubida]SFQ68119.1 amino acid adenylation domain-containing protein [Amycolatopsis rubida]
MRTRLSNAQEELRTHLAAVFSDDHEDVWTGCSRHGWLGLTVDSAHGGLGLGETEAVVLAEELGAAARPAAVLEHVACAETLAARHNAATDEMLGEALLGRRRLRLDLPVVPRDRVEQPSWWLRLSAHLLGLSRRAVRLAAERSRERRQFDGPIARFQGLVLPLAAHAARIGGLRLRLHQLAGELDRGVADPRDVAVFAQSVRAHAYEAVNHAVHVFGAAGLTYAEPISACHQRMLETGTRLVPDTGHDHKLPAPEPYWRTALRRRVPESRWAGKRVARTAERVHDLVRAAAARHHDQTAVTMAGEEPLSYRDLDRRANQLARLLRERGAGPGELVAVCLPRCVDLVVALLGVLKSGAAYLPLDPEYPETRLAFMLEDSGASVVLTQDWFTEWLPETPAAVVRLDTDEDLPGQPATPPEEQATAADLAYVIYTSGSTGTPKGVEIEHRGLVNRLCWDIGTFPLGPGDAVLHHTSLSFDISAMEIFGALVNGARVVLAPPGTERDTATLARTITEEQITAVPLVPSVLDVLLEERPGLKEATALRYLFSGGEALSADLCRRVFATVPWAELHNFYGPSENSVDVTAWHCTPDSIRDSVPIGVPLDNVTVYVVDDTGTPVAGGATGELLVGGAGLARGYRNRPELTGERFLPDPFSLDPHARVYRTGDLVRHRPDGALEYLGRLDEQVKIRGFRIEPGEIETALEQIASVRQAIVKPVGNVRLDAYVTCFDDRTRPDELLDQVRHRLPAHLVPSRLDILPAFPLMPNGKIDRSALAPSDDAGGGSEHEGGVRGTVRRLMADVLNQPSVEPAADFFDLGGTSLQAARFVARVRSSTPIRLDLGRFIQDPTCEGVLAHRSEAS